MQAARKEYPEWEEAQCHFIDGAHYADSHPKRITYKALEDAAKEVIDEDWAARQDRLWAMIERNLRAKFIDKACKWLRDNWHKYINIDADGVVCFGHWENDFRKAIKGG